MKPIELAATLLLAPLFAACGAAPERQSNPEPTPVIPQTPEEVPGSDRSGAELPADTSAEAIIAFVRAGKYRGWKAEPAPHPSEGPHDTVRTFFNGVLYDSLRAGNSSHPFGSMSVKELLSEDGTTITGHAVSWKDEGLSQWVWTEGFAPNYERPFYYQGNGNFCARCHKAGVDFVIALPPE
jgi:hypothetical protein